MPVDDQLASVQPPACYDMAPCSVLFYSSVQASSCPPPTLIAYAGKPCMVPTTAQTQLLLFIRTGSYAALARTCRLQRARSTCCNYFHLGVAGERPPSRLTEVWRHGARVGGTALSAAHRTPLSQARAVSSCFADRQSIMATEMPAQVDAATHVPD